MIRKEESLAWVFLAKNQPKISSNKPNMLMLLANTTPIPGFVEQRHAYFFADVKIRLAYATIQ